MERILINIFLLLIAFFCLWRGALAIKTKKFRALSWANVHFHDGKGNLLKGLPAIICGLFLIFLGCLIIYLFMIKGFS